MHLHEKKRNFKFQGKEQNVKRIASSKAESLDLENSH